MRIFNQSGYEIIINGNTVAPEVEITVGEMMFNSQPIYSDIGSVEIITEYSKRSFRCYGHLKAYNSDIFKDINGMPVIIVVNTIPQNLFKQKNISVD